MTVDQGIVLGVLAATIALFLIGRWRHDMVAMAALLVCVLTGLVPASGAFAGFGHPAVITVACVLVLSRGLQATGAVDVMARYLLPAQAGPTVSIAALTALGAALSGFMNNVGALALLMPVAVSQAKRLEFPPGRLLMPLAFGSILGGMSTLIGTPPNLIVSSFRSTNGAGSFGMFDFAPVGVSVAAAGVLFIAVVGWRLVPIRRQAVAEGFDTGAYITEARIRPDSKAAGMSIGEIESALDTVGAQLLALVRNEVRLTSTQAHSLARSDDILILEAEAGSLSNTLSALGLTLEEAASTPKARSAAETSAPGESTDRKRPSDVVLMELTVLPESMLEGRSASDLLLRTRYGINLLAVSRQGRRSMTRLRSMALRAGDLLLMQGPSESILEFANTFGSVPLAERALRIPNPRRAWLASGIMAAAIAGAAFGLLPAAISFAAGVLVSMAVGTVPPRTAYDAIDWPVIVLLAALIPVAGALESVGAAAFIAQVLLSGVAQGHAVVALVLILVVTMTLSDLINNAATAAVMCPIALSTAAALGANPDGFLMAVAVGASCAFLTPIGHQNNTLILGPGGFRFGDYWRLGLPVQVLVILVSVPAILWAWPLRW